MTKFLINNLKFLGLAAALMLNSAKSEAQFSGGRISASPNPCIAGFNGLCTAYISVNSFDSNQNFAVTVEKRGEGREVLFACVQGSGTNAAPWIGSDIYVFRLYETWSCDRWGFSGSRLIDSTVVTSGGGAPIDPPPRRPDMVLQMNIDDIYDVVVRGSDVQYILVQGASGVSNTRTLGSLPRVDGLRVSASASSSSWRSPSVTVLEQPSRFNDHTLRLRVHEPAGGRRDVTVNLFFN